MHNSAQGIKGNANIAHIVNQVGPQCAPMWPKMAPMASANDHQMTIWEPSSHKIEDDFGGSPILDESIRNYHVFWMSQRWAVPFVFQLIPGILGLPIY